MIFLNNISFKYPGKTENILEEINMTIGENDKAGLIGLNGCGKTTLLKLIAGKFALQEGNLSISKGYSVSYLPQDQDAGFTGTVKRFLKDFYAPLTEIEDKMRVLEEKMADSNDDKLLGEYSVLYEQYQTHKGYEIDNEIEMFMDKLEMKRSVMKKDYQMLSSGERAKVIIARLLIEKPDLLLLDEPTNHLDYRSIEWLEEHLRNYGKSMLIVSHDRYLLNKIADKIYELKNTKITLYSGNYEFYRQEKIKEKERQAHLFFVQQRKIRSLKEEIARKKVWSDRKEKEKIGAGDKGFISARAARLAKRAKAVQKRIEHMIEKEEAKKPRMEKTSKMMILSDKFKGEFILRAENLSKGYDDKILFKNISFSILPGQRIAIMGKNGSGKTTLLRILLEEITPDSGEVIISKSKSLKPGYFSQDRRNINPENTVIREMMENTQSDQTFARTMLGRLMIRKDDVNKKIKLLSMGERSKVELAKIICSNCNFLILDEPLNHLDIDCIEELEEMLLEFDGTILFVSHDRYFVSKLATERIYLGN